MLQSVLRVYFAGNRRRRENLISARGHAKTSLTSGLRSSLKFLGVMLLSRQVPLHPYFQHPQSDVLTSYSRRTLYIRLADIKSALPYHQKGLYGRGEEKL